MAIMRWDPFGEMLSMQRDMDRLVRRLGLGAPSSDVGSAMAWMPKVDVKTSDDDMVIYAELPGLDQANIDVEVTDGVLTIKGERNAQSEKEQEGWLIQERSYGLFERSLALPEGVDTEAIKADYKDGVLEIHVPKAAQALKPKTRRIALGAGTK